MKTTFSCRWYLTALAAVTTALLFTTSAHAAPDARAKDGRPVQVSLTLSPGENKSTAQLALSLKIEHPWYIYVKSSSSTVLQVDLELPPGVTVEGDWVRPKPRTIYQGEKVEVYVGDQILTRMLRIEPAPGGEITVNATVHYQACDPQICLPSEEIRVSAKTKLR